MSMFSHIAQSYSRILWVSKLLERFIGRHFNEYLQLSNLLPSLQSSLRPNNSTEKAVLRVLSDLLEIVKTLLFVCCLMILPNVDHSILCRHLELSWTSFSGHICTVVHSTSVVTCMDHLSSSSAGFHNAQSSPHLVHHVYC